MAKKSLIAREHKRTNTIKRLASVRSKLVELSKSISSDIEAREDAIVKLQKQPRDASLIRHRRRCRKCGRPRGVYRRFGLCRIHLREHLMNGEVPGGRKSSW